MSDIIQLPKPHTISGLSRLGAIQLRTSLNNPKWSNGIKDFIAGANAIAKVPDLNIPDDLKSDALILKWGEPSVEEFQLSDTERDAARTAVRYAVNEKVLVINKHSATLITLLGLE